MDGYGSRRYPVRSVAEQTALLVNGNFGYRDNPMANTNFIGDFEAEWLINRSGDIRLKAYNETNDRYTTQRQTLLRRESVSCIRKISINGVTFSFGINGNCAASGNVKKPKRCNSSRQTALPMIKLSRS